MIDGAVLDCAATNADATEGVAHGGGIYSLGTVTLAAVEIAGCNATSAFAPGGQGGGLVVATGFAKLGEEAGLRNNYATGRGVNILVREGGSATYVLPAPPGHWVPATVCEVWREACDTWDSSCQNTEASCKQDPTDNTDSCNALIDSVCKPATFNQRMPL